MGGICNTSKTNAMPSSVPSTQCHHKPSCSKEKMQNSSTHKSNYYINQMHSCGHIPTTLHQSVSIQKSTPNKSIVSRVHWQYSTNLFNRKWIYRYLLTLLFLMYAINCSPILLSNAQILKSNRTTAAITQNFNNRIVSSGGSGSSSVTQKASRNNRNNIRKEHSNANADVEIHERPSCHSCSLLKEAEADNLQSFKNHILTRLQLERAPNISMDSVTSVSESVLATFYNRNGERYIRRHGRNYDYMDEMMSDEPKQFGADKNKINDDEEEDDEDEEFFSSTQSIYSFPNGKFIV